MLYSVRFHVFYISSVLWWSLHPAGPAPRWLLHLAGFAPNEGAPSGRQWMFTVMMIKGWFIGRMIDVVQVLHLRTDSLITAPNDDQRPTSSRAALTTERWTWNRQTDRRTDIRQTDARHSPTVTPARTGV